MKTNRAYSVVSIKTVDDDKRIIEGIATTPTPDRSMDIIELDGIDYKLPLPFLYQHNSRQPLGSVIDAKIVKEEMRVRIQMAGAGIATFIDEAWALIKAGLITGLSIGFRSIEDAYNRETGGFHFIKTEWIELSAVTIPMNAEATITAVKSADALLLAATGNRPQVVHLNSNQPGASGSTSRTNTMTTKEQIAAFQAKRAAQQGRMDALMAKAGDEGRTLDATETQEYDGLVADVKAIDEHLVRLQAHEKALIAGATSIGTDLGQNPAAAAAARGGGGGTGVVQVQRMLPKAIGMARWAICLWNAGGNKYAAAELAKQYYSDTPEVELMLRAAVAAMNTTNATAASPLVPAAQNLQTEFLELLRPATLVGRIPGLRRVPFNISIPAQTGGGTYTWVGEGVKKPVGQLTFNGVTLRWAKIAGIIVMTEELMRFSNPAAETIIRDDMVKGTAQYIDQQFVDPTVAEVSNVSPAAITNGATTSAASGTTAAAFRTDMQTRLGNFITNNEDPSNLVILMSATVALNLSLRLTDLGTREFPDISINGGSILGVPVVVSQSVGARIIIVNANDILLADDGPVEIDVSREASIVMDSAPAASPQTTELVSFWQHNYVGLKVEKYITWKKARTTSVEYISNAAYTG